MSEEEIWKQWIINDKLDSRTMAAALWVTFTQRPFEFNVNDDNAALSDRVGSMVTDSLTS